MGRRSVFILSCIFVLGALVNCGGGGGGSSNGSNGADPSAPARLDGDYANTGPVVTDGTWVAWIARDKDRVLGHAGGSGADTGSPVAAFDSTQWYPNRIAYDGRYLVAEIIDGGDAEIVYYDTVAGGSVVTVTSNTINDREPEIDGGIVVWYADDGNDNEIFYYDIADPGQGVVQLTDNSTGDSRPYIEGGKIVWNGSDGGDEEIFYYDLNAASPTIIQVSDNAHRDDSPEVDDGGVVVWKMDDGNGSQIFYADMSLGAATFTPVQLTFGDPYDYYQDVHVDGRRIVWEMGTIYYCDIDAGTGTTVVTVVSPVSSNFEPAISGDRIVWQGFDGDTEIYSHLIGDPADSVLKVTSNTYSDVRPSLDGEVVVWRAYDGQDSDYVYRYDFSSDEFIRLSDEEFRSVSASDIVAVGGDTYWLDTSHNYRLFAAPRDGGAPVRTVTPPQLEAYNVDIDDGVLAYQTYGDFYEIHYADLNAVSFTTVQITHGTDYSENPVISNGVIAWEEYVDADSNYEIFCYDINAAAPTLINVSGTPSYDDGDVDIDNGIITWRASDGSDQEIWYADFSAGASTFAVRRVSDNTFTDYRPKVEGGVITWHGYDGDYEIFYADVSAGASTFTVEQLTDNATPDTYPVVSGGVVAWQGEGSSGSDYEIWYADVSLGASTVQAVEITSNDRDDWYPEIGGGIISWYAEDDEEDYEIFYYDLNAASPAPIQVTDNSVDDYGPFPGGGVLVWSTTMAPFVLTP